MNITVKFFASLREQTGKSDASISYAEPISVLDAWKQASGMQSMPENTLCAINMEYVNHSTLLSDGDEVAFFPPVTGG
ncbi:MAG: molybdopterin converting factor subunit 1 [Gammaproteobacteria bacterium]|nr:molybdopterin converting factor subunit 1 [Gammaproteobacteria bacterium]